MQEMDTRADWILVEAQVVTGDASQPRAEALAIANGHLLAVGRRQAVEALAGPATRVESLHGATVLPGFIDAHGHVLSLGFALQRVDLKGARTFQEVVDRVARRASRAAPGSWIQGRGWDQTLWPGRQFPHHGLLSEAVPGHPVVLDRIDGHASLVNAAALQAAGIDGRTPDPPGGKILHDARGEPTGVLLDNAELLIQKVIPPRSDTEKLAALQAALHHLAELGLTGVHDAGVGLSPGPGAPQGDAGWARVELYRRLLKEDRLPLRVYVMLGGNGVSPPPGGFFKRPPLMGEGDGLLTVRALKLGVDGALGSRGAALQDPYSDAAGNRGLVTLAQEPLEGLVLEAMQKGWQVAIHAIGDRGNRMALDAIAAAEAKVPEGRATRPRIEHAQVLAPQDAARFAAAGVIASIQPTHATSDRRWAQRRLGPERIKRAYAYKSLAREGVRLACGSDFPVESADPRGGLLAAMARQDASGEPPGGWRQEEALSPSEALACFTSGAAWAAFMEDEVGRLRVGMRADLTILDANPLEVQPERLMHLRVLRTVVGGRVVYEAPAADAVSEGLD